MRYPTRFAASLMIAMLCAFLSPLSGQEAKDAAALYKEAGQLQNAGKFAERLNRLLLAG